MPPAFSVPFSSPPPSTPERLHGTGRDHRPPAAIASTHVSTTPAAPPPSTANSFTPAGPPPPSSIWGDTFPLSGRGAGRGLGGDGDATLDPAPQGPSDDENGSYRSSPIKGKGRPYYPVINELGSSPPVNRPSGRGRRGHGSLRSQKHSAAESSALAVHPDLQREIVDPVAPTIWAIARDKAEHLGSASLAEADAFILRTEDIISMARRGSGSSKHDEWTPGALFEDMAESLGRLWGPIAGSQSFSEGPLAPSEWRSGAASGDDATPNAAFVASLLLQVHLPPAHASIVVGLLRQCHGSSTASGRESLQSLGARCTEQEGYWDLLFNALLCVNFTDVISILEVSDFSRAHTIDTDRRSAQPYSAKELGSIRKAVQGAITTLKRCPGVMDGDWDMLSSSWREFRDQARIEAHNLQSSIDEDTRAVITDSTLTASNSAPSKYSDLPLFIGGRIRALYLLLSGTSLDCITYASNWLEATVFLAVWYHGPEQELNPPHRSHGSARACPSRSATIMTYRRRLANAFDFATNQAGLHIDSGNAVEVGAACALIGDVVGCLALLQSWSLPVAAAVAEIASAMGWLPTPSGDDAAAAGFNESDLMVLSYGKPEGPASKDNILTTYANELFLLDRPLRRQEEEIEGWELGMKLLGRLDDSSRVVENVAAFIDGLEVHSSERAYKLISLCKSIGLDQEAIRVAERLADGKAKKTDELGAVLVYYAYAHKRQKVRDLLERLISICLVQSKAYPPLTELDPHLTELLHDPSVAFAHMAAIDNVAAGILSTQLSGYAALRDFYASRNQPAQDPLSQEASIAQKKRAIKPLLALIASAADNIQGGLFDRHRPAVVPVEGLLVLLGEALFLAQDHRRLLTLSQMLLLLRAVEDLQVVHPRILKRCEGCLMSALKRDDEASGAGMGGLFKKSVSNVTASSGFSLIDGPTREGQRLPGNGARTMLKSAWDWRQNLPRDVNGQNLLALIRSRLSELIGDSWLDSEVTEVTCTPASMYVYRYHRRRGIVASPLQGLPFLAHDGGCKPSAAQRALILDRTRPE